ncbi:hypothetical protein H9I45_09005 [Polaribacter haliotis]|uniref:Uncharacterized protein n=1 Tax=Polaribacter haliotis TaxID=1888915 RepID=A0A7L8ABX4_9FLAO|nr:hypothetical protein H9I45_09005 [Polaribacter haliotis]
MKKKTFLVLFTVLIYTCIVNGQVVPPPMPPPPPPGLPVDGGLLFLFVSGLIYGVNKVRQ